jgi:hypothetical protein
LPSAVLGENNYQAIQGLREGMKNTDGNKKQGCETNAAKRFIKNL